MYMFIIPIPFVSSFSSSWLLQSCLCAQNKEEKTFLLLTLKFITILACLALQDQLLPKIFNHNPTYPYPVICVNEYVLFFFLQIPSLRNWKVLCCYVVFNSYISTLGPGDTYRQVSNIRRTLAGNKIVDHSDVVGASPVGAAPTTSSFST